VQVPALFLLSIAINVCCFGVGNWPWEHFMSYVLAFAIMLWVYDSMAQVRPFAFPKSRHTVCRVQD
jgi:hypothetical protein